MTNVIKLRFSDQDVVNIADDMRTRQKEQLREALLTLIELNANLPRADLISEFSGCLVVIEAGVYGWRK